MTIEIKPHPLEILELDEETVAIARAKLAGVDFTEIYGDEDRSSPELMIRIQTQRIRDLFQTKDELALAFSSAQKTEQTYKDMQIDGIDLAFIRLYCERRQLKFKNDVEALMQIGFGSQGFGEVNV